jgi:hypothetical protein
MQHVLLVTCDASLLHDHFTQTFSTMLCCCCYCYCRQRRVNPAMLAVSGYAFCYPCVFSHVSEAHCCPVTRIPATLDHIRKLYEAM